MMNADSPPLLAEVCKARTVACIHWAPILPAEPDAAKGDNPLSATGDRVQPGSPVNSKDSVDLVLTVNVSLASRAGT